MKEKRGGDEELEMVSSLLELRGSSRSAESQLLKPGMGASLVVQGLRP